MDVRDSVVYVALDKMGGIASNVHQLQIFGSHARFDYRCLLVDAKLSPDSRFAERMPCGVTRVAHELPLENLHSVMARLIRALPRSDGVLVATDWLELAASSSLDLRRTVFFVLSGDYDYYYELAVRHANSIDAFIAVSPSIGERLSSMLPERRESIHCIPCGVAPSEHGRRPGTERLRLLYAGRIDSAKGVFDLPRIDGSLAARGVPVEWTLIGGGPDEASLRSQWHGAANVQWKGQRSMAEVAEAMAEQDLFVLPSRAEGLPIALLEAMSASVVPVVTDLPGVREVVTPGVTGFRERFGDVEAFAGTIAALAGDRDRLEAIGRSARKLVTERYHVRRQVQAYEALFARWRELRRLRRHPERMHYGSRLDQKWIPNALVRFVRSRRRPELRALLRARQESPRPTNR